MKERIFNARLGPYATPPKTRNYPDDFCMNLLLCPVEIVYHIYNWQSWVCFRSTLHDSTPFTWNSPSADPGSHDQWRHPGACLSVSWPAKTLTPKLHYFVTYYLLAHPKPLQLNSDTCCRKGIRASCSWMPTGELWPMGIEPWSFRLGVKHPNHPYCFWDNIKFDINIVSMTTCREDRRGRWRCTITVSLTDQLLRHKQHVHQSHQIL